MLPGSITGKMKCGVLLSTDTQAPVLRGSVVQIQQQLEALFLIRHTQYYPSTSPHMWTDPDNTGSDFVKHIFIWEHLSGAKKVFSQICHDTGGSTVMRTQYNTASKIPF